MAVYTQNISQVFQVDLKISTYHCHAVSGGNNLPGKKDVVSSVGEKEANNGGGNRRIDSQRQLLGRL